MEKDKSSLVLNEDSPWRVALGDDKPLQSTVNHPPHYMGKVECIDAIESATAGLTGLEAVCTANIMKYVWRWKRKNGLEDLRKARWYLDKLIATSFGKK